MPLPPIIIGFIMPIGPPGPMPIIIGSMPTQSTCVECETEYASLGARASVSMCERMRVHVVVRVHTFKVWMHKNTYNVRDVCAGGNSVEQIWQNNH
jgi:hypothetical protein